MKHRIRNTLNLFEFYLTSFSKIRFGKPRKKSVVIYLTDKQRSKNVLEICNNVNLKYS